jgi:hypothetical protein
MTDKEFYEKINIEMMERWNALSEEDQKIMRENIDSDFAKVAIKVLGPNLLIGMPSIRRPTQQSDYLDKVEKAKQISESIASQ